MDAAGLYNWDKWVNKIPQKLFPNFLEKNLVGVLCFIVIKPIVTHEGLEKNKEIHPHGQNEIFTMYRDDD